MTKEEKQWALMIATVFSVVLGLIILYVTFYAALSAVKTPKAPVQEKRHE